MATDSKRPPPLFIHYRGALVGRLRQAADKTLSFTYEPAWLASAGGFDLSPALPRSVTPFDHGTTTAYFENLLPEGGARDRFNREFRDAAKDPFAFLTTFGADCAGALTISDDAAYPERVDPAAATPITLADLDLMVESGGDLATQTKKHYHGRFSLAGAQDKIALVSNASGLAIPTGGGATTHILKPPIRRFGNGVDTVFNEYFCMRLAGAVGLRVPSVRILQSRYPYYLVERYDREVSKAGIVGRLHQIDFCQLFARLSTEKHEEDSGLGLIDVYEAIKRRSRLALPDLAQLLRWTMFNLLIGNNDSHLKNLSMMVATEGMVLSPFYDLLSTVVYRGITARFAFGIGKCGREQSRWYRLRAYHMRGGERRMGVRAGYLAQVFREVSAATARAAPVLRAECEAAFPRQTVFRKIERATEQRRKLLEAQAFPPRSPGR